MSLIHARRVFAPLLLITVAAFAAEDLRQTASQLYQQRDFNGAAAAVEKYLATQPADVPARMLLGICRQQLGDNHRAEMAFAEVVRLAPQDPQPRFYLALVRMSMGKFAEAAADARASLDLGGDAPPAHHLLGMVLEEQNQLEKALASYQSALKAGGGGSPDMQLSTGQVLLKLGRASEAVKHFDAAVQLNPKLPEAA